MGERLLGGYGPFYLINTGPLNMTRSCEARSRSGQLEFKVRLDVDFQLEPDAAIEAIEASDPIGSFVFRPLILEAQELSETFEITNDRDYQAALKNRLDPVNNITASYRPFQLIRLRVRVDPPREVTSKDEHWAILQNIDSDLIVAERRGDSETAKRLRAAKAAMKELRGDQSGAVLAAGMDIVEMRKLVTAMEDAGFSRDDPVVRQYLEKIEDYSCQGKPVVQDGRRSIGSADQKEIQDQEDDDWN
ncbi:hypothetical protein ATO11_04370 [Pseudaestuariivita atlantica]|uniref:Uncharacterized protein n=2 Tax=Pseudaestuariivita atlantica TaxID=1317121 RepID=A0A0L1JT98_9RHOB|nr:hypothetical protein ATO11_04370 [Pseudaestuariivita atlantica]